MAPERLERRRQRHREWSAARKAERLPRSDGVLVHPYAPHGRPSTYTNYGCRCERCRTAHTAAAAARRARRQQGRTTP